ncbi:MAG: hypothetical protein ACHQWU_17310 [Gemmatimonadales bacterium]
MERRTLAPREAAFVALVDASHERDEGRRGAIVLAQASTLTADEIYHANSVIALFNFYNTFVDLNGVAELTPEGYAASGVRLSTHGYGPPAGPAK